MTRIPIRRALISVYDKTGLEELASGLYAAGVEIISTGSTAARIGAAGVPVTPVEELTGFPECLDGRVKTLHPRVHAGLLADTANPRHEAELAGLRIEPFQLLVSNLYPFEDTVASGASPEECVEQIDIGGPAMIRAAAKNHGSVAVVIDPSRYADVLAALAEGGFTLDQRRGLAAEAFARTAGYDIAVASWFAAAYAPDEIARDSGWPAGGRRPVAARRRAALRREPAPAGGALRADGPGAERPPASRPPNSCTARPCRTTTTWTRTPPGAPPTISPSRAWPSSSTPTRAASPSAPTSPTPTPRRTPATRPRPSAAS